MLAALCAALIGPAASSASAQIVGGRAVLAPDRVPLGGVRVLLLRVPADSGAAGAAAGARRPDAAALDSAVSAADGVFYVQGRGPGTYRLRLLAPGSADEPQGGREFDSPPLTLAAGDLVEREFLIEAPSEPRAEPAARLTSAAAAPVDKVYFEFQVERPVRPLSMARVEFPRELRDRPPVPSADATLLVQFVVGVRGFAEMNTFKVLEYSDGAFIAPVSTAISRSRYQPARIAGRPVRQLVQQTFRFSMRTTGIGGGFRP